MPEYVYALHDFIPENEDEVSFRAGERIEVVERDDIYADGWWQGQNLAGKVGLFPVSYTTPAAPPAVPSNSSPGNDDDDDTGLPANQPTDVGPKTVLNTLPEESESGSPRPDANRGIIAPIPKAAPAKFLNGNHHDFERTSNDDDDDDDGDEVAEDEQRLQEEAGRLQAREPPVGDQVMKATLTDVQKAIEQLGRRNRGGGGAGGGAGSDLDDGNRSFSFASTGGDRDDTDTDFDLSDIDGGENGDDDVEGWHKGARMKLAEKARRAVEEAEKLEAMMGAGVSNGGGGGGGIVPDMQRAVAPPIEVEMSDESEDDDEREGFTSRSTAFQGIPEEPEEDETDGDVPLSHGKKGITTSGLNSSNEDTAVSLVLPEKDETQVDTATATRSTFRISSPPIDLVAVPAVAAAAAAEWERIPDSEVQSRSSTSSSRPLQRPPSANRNYQDRIKPASPSPMPFPSPGLNPETTQTQRADTPQEQQQQQQHSFESTPTIPTIPTNFYKSVSNPPPHSPTTGTAVSFISQPAQAQPRAMSPPFISTSSNQSKHASGTSAGSRNSGAGAIPPASPEPTSPLPPIPAAPVTPAPVPMQAVNSTMTTSTTIRPAAASPSPITTSSHYHVPPPVIVPIVEEKKKEKHPSEWTLEEVVDWLKSKGFDQDVCDKFTEQEITGDVLLELDVNLLKSEIGIMAFGKRVRISNAIADLRRPPSITYSDHQSGTGTVPTKPRSASPVVGSGGHYTPLSPNSQIHSRTQSQSHSFAGSIPHGQGLGHAYSQSIQSSLGSPLGLNGFSYVGGSGVAGAGAAGVNGNFLQPGPLVETPSPVGGEYVNVPQADEVGLGGGSGGRGLLKPRPAQLSLSPSDGALKAHATEVKPKLAPVESEERGHMSDGDVVPASSRMRRRLFGRSHDSASSSRRQSKDMSPMASPTTLPDHKDKEKEKEKDKEREGSVSSGRHGKGKRSMDAGKASDRLSIFGGTFGGSLSKARKPPPSADDIHTEKTSMFSLPRLHSGSVRKSSSAHRPSTPSSPPAKTQKDLGELSPKAFKERESRDSTVLRKRTVSSGSNTNGTAAGAGSDSAGSGLVKPGQSILEQIGEPDHVGWMRKRGDRYNSWKNRYFVLKGPHMYCLRSDSKAETKIKGYVHIVGYKVSVDENLDPGRYGFRIDHDSDKTHYFSSDEKAVVRDWMKAIMKATIDRDYTKPVVSSCNIPTIPLTVAQAMNPAPRPPSPTARAATQKALRRGDPNQLSTRDAQILMGLSDGSPNDHEPYQQDPSFPATSVANKLNALNAGPPPPRPSRDVKRSVSIRSSVLLGSNNEDALIDWANSHLPPDLHVLDSAGPLFSGLALLRLAESIKGKPSSPPVPDSAFPVDANDDKLDGLFRLFDFLLDNDVKMGSVSINDVRQNKRDKVVQLLKALKAWEDKRRAILQSIGKGAVQAGGFVAF